MQARDVQLPLKLDHLVIDMGNVDTWVAVGVPSQRYLWIMSRDWKMDDGELQEILSRIEANGYNVADVVRVPQKW